MGDMSILSMQRREVVLTDAVTAVATLLRPSGHRLDPFIAECND
jgi:hypothetical protein